MAAAGGSPDPSEIWISKAACGELARVQEVLTKALDLAQGAAPKRQRIEAEDSKAHNAEALAGWRSDEADVAQHDASS